MAIRLDAHRDEQHRDQQWHKPCRVATTANITISTALNNGDTLDGVTLATGDRVLVKDQSTGSQNGIYIVGASPARAYDMLAGIQAMGAFVWVISGSTNGQKLFKNTNTTLPTIDSTSLTFAQFSGNVATDSIWDAKGDLAAGTGADTAAKLTVGSNDTILMADSAQSTGLKWVASQTPSTQAFGDSAAEGTADTYARGDHKHGMPASGSGDVATDTIWDAKGDLAGGTGANTAARLAVGTNGYLLSADSAESTGLKWIAPGAATLDLSGLTIERSVQHVSDYVAGYDTSAADERGFPVGALRGGRGGSTIFDELFFTAASNVWEGGVVQSVSGSGATISDGTPEANHPGIIQCSTGTTAGGKAGFAGGAGVLHTVLGGGKVRFGICFKLPTLSDGTNTYTIRAGFQSTSTGDSTDGVYFRYSHGVNSGEWEGICRASSTETARDTNVAADTNWHTYEFEINAAASSVQFIIDGSDAGAAVTTNIPTAAMAFLPLIILKSAGTTARTALVDAYWVRYDFTTAR